MQADTPFPADVKKLADSIGIRVTSDFCLDLEATRRGFAEAIMADRASRATPDAPLPTEGTIPDDVTALATEIAGEDGLRAIGLAVRAIMADRAARPAADAGLRGRLTAFINRIEPKPLVVQPSKTQKIARRLRKEVVDELRAILDEVLSAAPAVRPAGEAVWVVTSKSGMHIGLWHDKEEAESVVAEYEGSTLAAFYAAPPTDAGLIQEAIEALEQMRTAFLARHGCYPLDRVTPEQRQWTDAMHLADATLNSLRKAQNG